MAMVVVGDVVVAMVEGEAGAAAEVGAMVAVGVGQDRGGAEGS
jgi:hypothetical protein